jgi:transcriptional regulator with XRE-family HTH domain
MSMSPRLEHVIARNVAELRAERDATQHDLAASMHDRGFRWQSNRVAQIETLRRPVSLLEIVGLSRVFGVPVSRLLAGEDKIDLPSGAVMPLTEVIAALAGEIETVSLPEAATWLMDDPARDDLRKVAKSLGLDIKDLQTLAFRLWGVPFHAERERRLGDVSGLSKRSAQTKAGHVTRALLADIRDYLGEGKQRVDRLKELHAPGGAARRAQS